MKFNNNKGLMCSLTSLHTYTRIYDDGENYYEENIEIKINEDTQDVRFLPKQTNFQQNLILLL